MSIFKGVCHECETCHRVDNSIPWLCNGCGTEVCEHCFYKFAICRACADGKTDDECKAISGRDWSE